MIYETMKKLVDKDAIIAKIKTEIKECDEHLEAPSFYSGKESGLSLISDFINTLPTKEVDLSEDSIEEISAHLDSIIDGVERMTSGNFMHNRAAIGLSAKIIKDRLASMGIKTQKV